MRGSPALTLRSRTHLAFERGRRKLGLLGDTAVFVCFLFHVSGGEFDCANLFLEEGGVSVEGMQVAGFSFLLLHQ